MRPALLCLLALTSVASPRPVAAAPAPAAGPAALAPIVGTWKAASPGVDALSRCAWTPQHLAVVCDQSITTPDGPRHSVNLYTFDAASGEYAYYGVNRPGDAVQAVPLSIQGATWIYGGQAAQDGVTYRTINDFSDAPRAYVWRRESTRDGQHWTTIAGGRSERVGADGARH